MKTTFSLLTLTSLVLASSLIVSCSDSNVSTSAASDATLPEGTVITAAGTLKGSKHANKEAFVFKGIQYGQSTAGTARFRAPEAVTPWEGVKEAYTFGDTCPQTGNAGRTTLVEDEILPMSEDCLVLNLWTPGFEGERPVMVWLHGRGFSAGAGSEREYDGPSLAERGDVVVITINHRLNIFGHLYLGEIGGEEFESSGLAGLLDVELALSWVRENIHAFGGDPDNVTIFGESGGGSKVATMMGIPSAKGLFHKGILQSGPTRTGIDKTTAIANTKEIMSRLNVSTAEQLQAVTMEELLAARMNSNGATTPRMAPVVDGKYLPQNMFDPSANPSAHGVPILIGSNKDEQLLFSRTAKNFDTMTDEELLTETKASHSDGAEFLIGEYRKSRPNANAWDISMAIRSARFGYGSILLAEVQQEVAPVYLYMFEFEASEKLKAAHGAEIPFAFNNASANPGDIPFITYGATVSAERLQEVTAVENAVSEAWISFAKTGNPNHSGIPDWPTYDLETRSTMVFNIESEVANDLRPIERLAHKSLQPE